MGLFSGSFGSGLVTGLATSVDKSLQDAMDKRDEEVSRARQFWMTRQAQKMDLADEHDAEAEKLLNRMIDEFGGDVAKGLAAYKAAGGNINSVQSFFDSVDNTRTAGIDYNINEKLALDGINLEDFADLTKEQAFGAIRQEVKPIDIQMEDTGLMSKIGLGMKDLGKGVSDDINTLIPAREQNAIEGLSGAILDRTGTIENIQFKNDLLNSLPDLEKQMAANLLQQSKGMDLMGNPLDEAALLDLDKQHATLLEQWSTMLKIKADAQSTGGSLSEFSGMYKTRLVELEDEIAFKVNPEGIAMATSPEGGQLIGDDALAYLQQRKDDLKAEFVGSLLVDSSGNYVNRDAEIFANGAGLGRYVDSVQASGTGTATEDGAVGSGTDMDVMADVPEQAAIEKTREKYPSPLDFANATASKASSPEDIWNALNKIYPEVDATELSVIAENAFANLPEPETPEPTREFTPSGPEITVDDAGRKTADGVTWNPNETPTMVDVARNENVDMAIRKAAFEDLILKTNMDEATQERLASEYGLE